MPFKQVDVEKILSEKAAENAEFKEAWESSRNEYTLLHDIVRIRKEKNLTQKELAEKTGSRQQEISRLENREHSPSLRTVCKIVECLGYELRLVKK